MLISIEQMKAMRKAPNSAFDVIMPEFLFHSNKLEGSTFAEDELMKLVETGTVEGNHPVDDVLETLNSIEVFKYVIDTLGCPIDEAFLTQLNQMLFKGTETEKAGFSGHYKTIPNRIRNSSVQVALPSDTPSAMTELSETWENSIKDFDAIVDYHVRFEHVHPFQDGNGRIGRFVMLKQCIEQNLDLIVVDEALEKPYKAWLEIAQTTGDAHFLKDLLKQCQNRFEAKMKEQGIIDLIPSPEAAQSLLDAE